VHGKGGVERVVPTHSAVWEAVRGLPHGPIARDRYGRRANRRGVDGRGNYHLHHRLGYPHWSMHDLRRWYSTNVHELAGGDIRVTQELLGHASPATTAIYIDVLGSKKTAAVSGLKLVA
jgi:integrase/recombinase XerC